MYMRLFRIHITTTAENKIVVMYVMTVVVVVAEAA